MGCGGGRHAFAAMRRGATVVALDYSEARAQGRRATSSARCSRPARSPRRIAVAAVNGDALRAAVPRRLRSTASSPPRCSSTSGTTRRDRRARAGAAPGRPHGGHGADALARAGLLGARPQLPRRARRPRPHLPPARARGRSSSRPGCGCAARTTRTRCTRPTGGSGAPAGVNNADRSAVRSATTTSWCGSSPKNPRWLATVDRVLNPVIGKSLVVYTREGARTDEPRRHELPSVEGVIAAASSRRPSTRSRAVQLPDGNIPWTPGGHTDPWNLVEAAMALDVGGRHARGGARVRVAALDAEPRRLAGTRTTSATTSRTRRSTPTSPATSRPASGTTTSPPATPRSSRSSGPSSSARSTTRSTTRPRPARSPGAPTTRPTARCSPGSSSIHRSLRCAIAIAERLGHERPDWELSLGALAIAIAHRPERFLDKDRWAMDWYYPILGGVLRGQAAHDAHRRRTGTRSWSRAGACAASRTSRGSPRPRRASS